MTNKEFLKIVQSDPLIFPEKILNLYLWEKQKDIIRAIHEHERVCVRACNSASKTHTLAAIILSFLFSYPPCKIVSTSAQKDQVRFALWKEIERMWINSKIPLADASKFFTMRIELAPDWFALGIRPLEYNIESMQGFHAENVLIAFDESSSLPEQFYEAANSLMTHTHCRWIIIGNPFSKATPFGEAFDSEGWYPIHISAFDTPNVKAKRNIFPFLMSYDWPQKMEKQWGKESSAYKVRVLGEFPDSSTEELISVSLAKSILSSKGPIPSSGPIYIGIDPSGFGSNNSVILVRRELCILEIRSSKLSTDDMIVSEVRNILDKYKSPAIINVDGGWGKGVYERIKQNFPNIQTNLIFMSSTAGESKIFFNLKTETAYRMKEMIENGLFVAPQARGQAMNLVNDLTTLRVFDADDGRKRLEGKRSLTKRLHRSIDFVDALLLTIVNDNKQYSASKSAVISVDITPPFSYNHVRLPISKIFMNNPRIFGKDNFKDEFGFTLYDMQKILKR